jgi:chaperonin GroES
VHYYTKYDFMPNPEGGVYGVGLGQLLKPINDAVNTSLNMLIDAGHLQNAGGGFIGKGLSLHSGAVKFRPGEYKVVNSAGAAVRDAVVPLTFPGPSPVLFELLGTLVEAGKDISASNNILAGDIQSAQMQPTTMLALIEQGLKVFVAIYKRVHRSLKQEYSKLYRLNRLYLQDTAEYRVGDEWKQITREDYERGSGVQPISDPAMVSDMQKLARAQFLAAYQNDPLCDPMEIRKRIFESANLADVEKLFAQQPPGPPPELVLAEKELAIKAHRDEAAAVKDMALAIKAIAEADAADGDQNIQWAQQQLALLKLQLEASIASKQQAAPANA